MALNRKVLIYGDITSDFHSQRERDEFLRYAPTWTADIWETSGGAGSVSTFVDDAISGGYDMIFYAISSVNSYTEEWSRAYQNDVLPVLPMYCSTGKSSACEVYPHINEWMSIGGDTPSRNDRQWFGPYLELSTYAGVSGGTYGISSAVSYTTPSAASVMVGILEADSNIDLNNLTKMEALLEARARLRTKGDNYSAWSSPDDDGYGWFDHQTVTNNYSDISSVRIQPPLGVFAENVDDKHISINWQNYDVPKFSKTKVRDVKRDEIIYEGSGEFPRVDTNGNPLDGFEIRNGYENNEFEVWHEDNSGNGSKRISVTNTIDGNSLNFEVGDIFFLDVNNNGDLIGTSPVQDPQKPDKETILNYFPIFVDYEVASFRTPLTGEIKVLEDGGSGSEYIFAAFDTSNDPTFEFLGDGSDNNRVFIQSDYIIRAKINTAGGTSLTTPITRDLKPKRVPSSMSDPTKSEVEKEVSAARLARKTNILEFKNRFGLNIIRFFNDVENFIDTADLVSPVKYGYSGNPYRASAVTPYATNPVTSSDDQDLSYGRKVQNYRKWLTF